MTETSEGFPPVASLDARVLVLGSLPGRKSLSDQEYYAHPQNAFWPIMSEIFGVNGNYCERCIRLTENKVALWDVLQASVRAGSMDADIRLDTATPNDFETFLRAHSRIEHIVFNGRKAEQLFHRLVTMARCEHLRFTALPSTSPAYASMPFSGKLGAWKTALVPDHPGS